MIYIFDGLFRRALVTRDGNLYLEKVEHTWSNDLPPKLEEKRSLVVVTPPRGDRFKQLITTKDGDRLLTYQGKILDDTGREVAFVDGLQDINQITGSHDEFDILTRDGSVYYYKFGKAPIKVPLPERVIALFGGDVLTESGAIYYIQEDQFRRQRGPGTTHWEFVVSGRIYVLSDESITIDADWLTADAYPILGFYGSNEGLIDANLKIVSIERDRSGMNTGNYETYQAFNNVIQVVKGTIVANRSLVIRTLN